METYTIRSRGGKHVVRGRDIGFHDWFRYRATFTTRAEARSHVAQIEAGEIFPVWEWIGVDAA